MTTYHYHAKKIGSLSIQSDLNFVSIHTTRLTFKSLNQDVPETLVSNYAALFGNIQNVKLLNDGRTWPIEQVQTVIDMKTAAWNKGDPFSMFSIYETVSGRFMGSVTIKKESETYQTVGAGHSNVIEVGFIIDEAFWRKGYGTEIAVAAKKYIRHVVGIMAGKDESPLPKEIVATAHPDNAASRAILQKTLKHVEPELLVKYDGNPRFLFFKPLKPAIIIAPEADSLAFSGPC